MILTKAKENNLLLSSGVTELSMRLDTNLTCGNYWVDWAEAFVAICEDKLGLEIEKGPGTSVGIIQSDYGPIRYQYDCDWTQVDGRVPEHDCYERGFTLWENVDLWDVNYSNNNSGEDDATAINLLNKGIDRENRRFDFIVWFTSQSNDSRNGKTGERLGLRFKYPLTNERGYNCSYYISPTPCCLPWKKINTTVNNECRLKFWNYRYGRTERIVSGNLGDYDNTLIQLKGVSHSLSTQQFTDSLNYNWLNYADVINDNTKATQLYNALGGTYSNNTPKSYQNNELNLNKIEILCSKTKNTINLRVKDNKDRIAIDILYGNLMKEELSTGETVVNSFIAVNNASTNNYMFKYLLTESNNMTNPPKQINRPTTINLAQQPYCGISRLLLQKEEVHCEDLYQVFSFSSLMNSSHYTQQVFVDKNEIDHPFILFNFGWGETAAIRNTTPAFAIPI